MKIFFISFFVIVLSGCTYTDVYVHEDTHELRESTISWGHENVPELLKNKGLVLIPNFREFRPGFDHPRSELRMASTEPFSVSFEKATFINMDTGFRQEIELNEIVKIDELHYIGDYYIGYLKLLNEAHYKDFYGASEIEMVVIYSTDNNETKSMKFILKLMKERTIPLLYV